MCTILFFPFNASTMMISEEILFELIFANISKKYIMHA